ncbi:MAG: lipase family protein [Phascolarctobacterium sp.]|nr:lipase family protein [Phascolarctobacterium sp.]
MKKILLALLCLCFYGTAAFAAEKSIKEQLRDSYYTAISAASCLGVYLPERSSEFSFMRSHGWEIAPYAFEDEDVRTNFSIASNTCADCGMELYMVTFKGTTNKKDWGINLKTSHTAYGGTTLEEMEAIAKRDPQEKKPAVHEGFNTYVDSVLRSSVVDAQSKFKGVFKKVYETPNSHLILTGHSLGGAAATLLGERLISLGMPKEKFTVITFGAPAIGNDEFAMEYGDKIDLLRVTNTSDPIPGSLQTFFGGYKQFGEHVKYHISPRISSNNHDIAMYVDYSVSEYYKAFDKAVAAGIAKALPYNKVTAGKPLVALWMHSSPGLAKRPYVPDIKRLIAEEYMGMLPSYVVMDDALNAETFYRHEDIMRLSREVGAEYVVICGIDGNQSKDKDYWYIVLNQGVFKADGSLMSIVTFAKKVSATGNIQATGENLLSAKEELQRHLPFVTVEQQKLFCYY